jgi:hypothetical protein
MSAIHAKIQNWLGSFCIIYIKREAQWSSEENIDIQGCKIFVWSQFKININVGEEVEEYKTSIRSIQLLKMMEKSMTFSVFRS